MAVTDQPSNLDPGSTYSQILTVTLDGGATDPEAIEQISVTSIGAGIDSIAVPDLSGAPLLMNPGESVLFSIMFTIETSPTYTGYPNPTYFAMVGGDCDDQAILLMLRLTIDCQPSAN